MADIPIPNASHGTPSKPKERKKKKKDEGRGSPGEKKKVAINN